jgi:hypothetical protein
MLAQRLRNVPGEVACLFSDARVTIRETETKTMCGIAGEFVLSAEGTIDEEKIVPMVSALGHRGPDEWGYYVEAGGSLLFASEMKAIFRHGAVRAELDGGSVWRNLGGVLPPGETLFKNIKQVEPGSMLIASESGTRQVRYWDLTGSASEEDQIQTAESDAGQAAEFYRLLEDSVRVRLRSDVPVGVYLSGGMDSSSVACIAARLAGGPVKAFTVGFDDAAYDEAESAQKRLKEFLARQTVWAGMTASRAYPDHRAVVAKFGVYPYPIAEMIVYQSGALGLLSGECRRLARSIGGLDDRAGWIDRAKLAGLSPARIREAGIFSPLMLSLLLRALRLFPKGSYRRRLCEMGAIEALSLHILHELFCTDFRGHCDRFARAEAGYRLSDGAVGPASICAAAFSWDKNP